MVMGECREYTSTLSTNRVYLGIVGGRLEITFDGPESSWGEALSEEDTSEVAALLAKPTSGEMGTAEYHEAYIETPQEKQERLREKQTDSWYRELQDGRVEIMCKAPGYRLRVSASAGQAWQAVEMFERWTGLVVQSERRPPRVYAPPRGQLSMTELEPGGSNDGED